MVDSTCKLGYKKEERVSLSCRLSFLLFRLLPAAIYANSLFQKALHRKTVSGETVFLCKQALSIIWCFVFNVGRTKKRPALKRAGRC
jgi:hypothetical protein